MLPRIFRKRSWGVFLPREGLCELQQSGVTRLSDNPNRRNATREYAGTTANLDGAVTFYIVVEPDAWRHHHLGIGHNTCIELFAIGKGKIGNQGMGSDFSDIRERRQFEA